VSLSKIRLRTTYVNWSVCGRADATSLGHAPHPIPSGRRCVTLLANAGTRASGPQGRACHLVGWGKGNPGFPFPQPPLATPGAPSGRGAVRQAHRRWGTPGSLPLNRRWGHLAPPQAGARFDRLTAGGESRVPLSPTAVSDAWHPFRQGRGSTGSPQVGNPGFPFPQPPLGAPGTPSGRGAVRQAHRRWGTPGSPFPNRRWGHLAPPQAGARFDRLTAGGEPRVPCPSTAVGGTWHPLRQGRGSTGSPQVGNPGFPFPQPPVGAAGTPTGRGMGNPGFPIP